MVQYCEWVSQYAMSMLSSQSMNSARIRRGMLATLPGPRRPAQRVELTTPERGGVLGQGSVLAVSSYPSRTSVVSSSMLTPWAASCEPKAAMRSGSPVVCRTPPIASPIEA